MDIISLLKWFVVVGSIGIVWYWYSQERSTSRADKTRSHHTASWQRAIRWLPQIIGLILILQLIGLIHFDLALASGLQQDFFISGLIIFWAATALAIWARQTLGVNWAHAADVQVIPGQALVTQGPYQWIRHPIYVAFFLMFIGIELIVASWLIVLALPLAVFLLRQSQKEEVLLIQTFGQQYRDYIQRTGMFIPKIR